MKKTVLLLAFAAFLATTQSCIDPFPGAGLCISGVGDIVREELTFETITAVSNETVIDIEIVQGNEQKVVAEGHENMIGELDLKLVSGELSIDLKGHCYNSFKMKIFLTLPTLKSVKVRSVGDVELGDFSGLNNLKLSITSTGDIIGNGALEVLGKTEISTKSTGRIELDLTTDELISNISSTGNIVLKGSCETQTIEMSGTGSYSAYNFVSQYCTIETKGTGDAKLYVSEKIDATINSVGSIYVKGNPRVTIRDNSVGDFHSID